MHGETTGYKRRRTVVATSAMQELGGPKGIRDFFTYGDSMLFLKCVTDKGGSARTNGFKFSIGLAGQIIWTERENNILC